MDYTHFYPYKTIYYNGRGRVKYDTHDTEDYKKIDGDLKAYITFRIKDGKIVAEKDILRLFARLAKQHEESGGFSQFPFDAKLSDWPRGI